MKCLQKPNVLDRSNLTSIWYFFLMMKKKVFYLLNNFEQKHKEKNGPKSTECFILIFCSFDNLKKLEKFTTVQNTTSPKNLVYSIGKWLWVVPQVVDRWWAKFPCRNMRGRRPSPPSVIAFPLCWLAINHRS